MYIHIYLHTHIKTLYIYIYICHAQSIYLRCCWIQYESLNSAPINGYYGEWPILVRHLWIAQLYMDPLFGCAIWSNCANSPIARDIYIYIYIYMYIYIYIYMSRAIGKFAQFDQIAQPNKGSIYSCAIHRCFTGMDHSP